MSASSPSRLGVPSRQRGLGALRHRHYRLYFGGQAISAVGTWMQSLALPWLALQLTHSALLVGGVLALQHLPAVAASPARSLIADRYPKRSLLLVTQATFILPAVFLFGVSSSGVVRPWMLFGAALAWGLIQIVDAPTRQGFALELVGREDLMHAIALNSTLWNAAAVVGSVAAGALIAAGGLPVCFLVNALTSVPALVTLALMGNLHGGVRTRARGDHGRQVVEGARHVRRDQLVAALLLVVVAFALFGMNRLVLVPLFAADVLQVGAAGFGVLMAALGLGTLIGAVTLPVLRRRVPWRHQFWIALAWAAALAAFGVSRTELLSAGLLVVAGVCQMWFLAAASARIQLNTPDPVRGRVAAFYAQAVMAAAPVGSVLAGALAAAYGAPAAVLVVAVAPALIAVGVRVFRPSAFTLEPRDQDL
jgi:predicted MFS family arabinose efflux permease